MQGEVEEMLAWMLELNESSHLLDWLMSQCYSQPSVVAARCFRALVRVFSKRDFPCEFISLFVLCQAMLGDPAVTDAAVHMIEILKRQFLDNSMVVSPQLVPASNNVTPNVQLRPTVVPDTHTHCLPMDQQAVCRNLANSYPHLTITIFSGPRGWGSEEATQLLLNNLMYLTICLAPDHEHELADLWRALALSYPANLPVILNYLYVVTDSVVEVVSPMRDSPMGDRFAAASEDASKEGVRLLPCCYNEKRDIIQADGTYLPRQPAWSRSVTCLILGHNTVIMMWTGPSSPTIAPCGRALP
ncbi:hypothetical protein OSTOST_23692 [Ostertagia ostertagi]